MGFSRQEHWSGLPFPSPHIYTIRWKIGSCWEATVWHREAQLRILWWPRGVRWGAEVGDPRRRGSMCMYNCSCCCTTETNAVQQHCKAIILQLKQKQKQKNEKQVSQTQCIQTWVPDLLSHSWSITAFHIWVYQELDPSILSPYSLFLIQQSDQWEKCHQIVADQHLPTPQCLFAIADYFELRITRPRRQDFPLNCLTECKQQFQEWGITKDHYSMNWLCRQRGTQQSLFVKIPLCCPMVTAGASKHVFIIYLLFLLHINDFHPLGCLKPPSSFVFSWRCYWSWGFPPFCWVTQFCISPMDKCYSTLVWFSAVNLSLVSLTI